MLSLISATKGWLLVAEITLEGVRFLLAPWLGSFTLDTSPEISEGVFTRLCSYRGGRGPSLMDVENEVESFLHLSIYRATNKTMRLWMDNGSLVEVYSSHIAQMADDVMFLLFSSLTVYTPSLQTVEDYAMRKHSLSALRALYTVFARLQTPAELSAVRRQITTLYKKEDYEYWLEEADRLSENKQ